MTTTNQTLRQDALSKALDSFDSFESPQTEAVLERATAFEKYLVSGNVPEKNVRAKDA